MPAGPARERVRLVIADMADRGGRINRLQSAECHDPPFAVDLAPVAGGLPAFVGSRGKTVHQPERGRAVAAVLHEGQPFGIGDEVAGEPDRANEGAVRGLFIVEMEAVVAGSDGLDPLVGGEPFRRGTLLRWE